MEKENNEKKDKIEETKQFTKIYNFKKGDMEGSKKLKVVIIILVIIALLTAVYFGIDYYNKNHIVEDVDNSSDVDEVLENTIDLDNNTFNGEGIVKTGTTYTINKDGIYTITGTTTNSNVVVDTNGDVTIILDNANIRSSSTAAILGKNGTTLTITLKDNTTNYVADGGNSEYDAAIFSNSKLKINGNGTLNVTGNVEEGIATENNDLTIENGNIKIVSKDDGINAGGEGGVITINGGNIYVNANGDGIDSNQDVVINGGTIFVMGSTQADNAAIDSDNLYKIAGGTIVALGNGMMEAPSDQSTQKIILFNLNNKIASNTLVALLDNDDNVITVFKSEKDFSTITISTSDVIDNTYSLYTAGSYTTENDYGIFTDGSYTKGSNVIVDNSTLFEVKEITNWFGKTDKMEGQPGNLPR